MIDGFGPGRCHSDSFILHYKDRKHIDEEASKRQRRNTLFGLRHSNSKSIKIDDFNSLLTDIRRNEDKIKLVILKPASKQLYEMQGSLQEKVSGFS